MDFLLWAARSLHVFSVIVWFGGLLYQAVVAHPVAEAEKKGLDPFTLHLLGRFQPFVWMSVWTIAVTGVALMLFDTRFLFFVYENRWSVLLGLKQVVFLLMVIFSFGYARMLGRLREEVAVGNITELAARLHSQMLVFGKLNTALAIIALLLAAGMR